MIRNSELGKTVVHRAMNFFLVLYLILAPVVTSFHLAFADHLHRYDPFSHRYMDVLEVQLDRSSGPNERLEPANSGPAVGTYGLGLWVMEPCVLSGYLTINMVSEPKGPCGFNVFGSRNSVSSTTLGQPAGESPISFAPKHSPPITSA